MCRSPHHCLLVGSSATQLLAGHEHLDPRVGRHRADERAPGAPEGVRRGGARRGDGLDVAAHVARGQPGRVRSTLSMMCVKSWQTPLRCCQTTESGVEFVVEPLA